MPTHVLRGTGVRAWWWRFAVMPCTSCRRTLRLVCHGQTRTPVMVACHWMKSSWSYAFGIWCSNLFAFGLQLQSVIVLITNNCCSNQLFFIVVQNKKANHAWENIERWRSKRRLENLAEELGLYTSYRKIVLWASRNLLWRVSSVNLYKVHFPATKLVPVLIPVIHSCTPASIPWRRTLLHTKAKQHYVPRFSSLPLYSRLLRAEALACCFSMCSLAPCTIYTRWFLPVGIVWYYEYYDLWMMIGLQIDWLKQLYKSPSFSQVAPCSRGRCVKESSFSETAFLLRRTEQWKCVLSACRPHPAAANFKADENKSKDLSRKGKSGNGRRGGGIEWQKVARVQVVL